LLAKAPKSSSVEKQNYVKLDREKSDWPQTKRYKMKKDKKKQDDRLLKQLSRMERKHQESIRKLILSDPIFTVA
jgi:hypothetical protein